MRDPVTRGIERGAAVFGFLKAWKRNRKAKKAGRPLDETAEDFNSTDEVPMNALIGAAKSKLVWLGVGQVVYGLFQLWATGDLSAETAGPVLSGALTIVLRAMTDQSLSEKSKQ